MKRLDWKDPFLKRAVGVAVVSVVGVAILLVVWRLLNDSGNILTQIGRLVSTVSAVLAPFFLAGILAYVLLPLVRLIEERLLAKLIKKERHRMLRRGMAVIITYLLLLGGVTLLISSLVPAFVGNIKDFWTAFPGYIETVERHITNFLRESQIMSNQYISSAVRSTIDTIQGELDVMIRSMGQGIVSAAKRISSTIAGVFITFIGSIYFLIDGERMKRGVKRFMRSVFGEKRAEQSFELTRIFDRVFGGYVRASLMDSVLVGVFVFVALLAFSAPYSAMFAVLNAVLNLVPYFGPIIGWVITVGVLLLVDPIKALYAGITVLIVQQIDGYIVAPKMMGDNLNMRPLYIMLSVAAGGVFFGIPGMLLMVPFVAFAGALLSRYTDKKLGPSEDALRKEEAQKKAEEKKEARKKKG